MAKIRLLRSFLLEMREKKRIDHATYISLIAKAKGGYFRNRNHLKLFMTENNLFKTKTN